MCKLTSVPKSSSIDPAVSTELWLVTDGQADTGHRISVAYASRSKSVKLYSDKHKGHNTKILVDKNCGS